MLMCIRTINGGLKMKAAKDKTFWNHISRNYKAYPKLSSNISCDVVIVGGGISGCLTNYYLSQYNIDTVVIEKESIAQGSTLLSSGILKCELSKELSELSKLITKEHAVRAYKLCQKSIDDVESILWNISKSCDFKRIDNLYINRLKDTDLKKEFNLRASEGFAVDYMDKELVQSNFACLDSDGIYSKSFAVIDPLKFCHALIKASASKNARVYENTSLTSLDFAQNKIRVNTQEYSITCKKVVFTAGSQALKLITDNIVRFIPSYTLVTNELKDLNWWYKKCLIHEVDENIYNIRPINNNRILIQMHTPEESTVDDISKKLDIMLNKIRTLLPENKGLKADYFWKCSYAETKDGLPYIGEHSDFPNCYFNLGLGGSGDTLSAAGAQIIKDLILYNSSPDSKIFNFKR